MGENKTVDSQYIMGKEATIAVDQGGSMVHADGLQDMGYHHDPHIHTGRDGLAIEDYENKPTEEERITLRRVPGKLPITAYLLCAVEFCERGSYYGVKPLIGNFVNRKMPKGGNGAGAPAEGTNQTAGALGLGTVKASAASQSFSLLAYALPLFFGWLADTKTGRFPLVCYGIVVVGIAHVLMVGAGAPALLQAGTASAPYFISLYILAIGSAMFKPNISPMLLDQMPSTVPETLVLKSGEKVIVDPEATTERVMLWFYLLINVGGFMNVPTAYTEKYVGWWLSFLVPLLLYLPLPLLLWWLRKRLVLKRPGGSDLGNLFRVLGVCLKRGGFKKFGRHGFWESAKPSVIAQSGRPLTVPWNDQFVEDVRRTFQACGIFCFFPIQYLNDNSLGGAADYTTTMMITNGVPNDVIANFNSLSIIIGAPVLNYMLYPLLRRYRIHFGPAARITFGLFLSSVAGVGYTVINYYAYLLGPCGEYGTSDCVDADGISAVAPISIWLIAIPYFIGGVSELFVNVPAFGIAYSRAPENMRGLVSALNLFSTAIAYAIGLACAAIIRDPLLTWDLGAPAIIGFVATVLFYWLFRHIDKEEYVVTNNGDYHLRLEEDRLAGENATSTSPIVGSSLSEKGEHPATTTPQTHKLGDEEEIPISSTK